jgi:Tfp pilus assembly protein FimT
LLALLALLIALAFPAKTITMKQMTAEELAHKIAGQLPGKAIDWNLLYAWCQSKQLGEISDELVLSLTKEYLVYQRSVR